MAFVSLAETLKVDWSSELYSKRIRRMDPSFFLLHVLFAFKAEMGHNPRASARDEDLKKLQQLRETTLTKLAVPTSKIPDEMLGEPAHCIFPKSWRFSTECSQRSAVCRVGACGGNRWTNFGP